MRWPIYQAKHVIHASGIIAYPTETVWGLGCDPFDGAALNRIIKIKQRDAHKGLILVGSDISQFDFLLDGIDQQQRSQLEDSWPGPVTYLVAHNNKVHPLVHGQFATVAIRVSSHPLVQELCEAVGGPIVSTSANFAGRPTARSAIQARKLLGHKIDFILAGPLGSSNSPSRIIDLRSGRVLRH